MKHLEFLNNIDRRDFLKVLSITGAAGLIYPKNLIAELTDTKSRVVIVEDSKATKGISIKQDVVQIMINEGIKSLSQENDLGEAWKLLLPNINLSSKISIKVNCINSNMPTHTEVTYSVVNALTKMMFDSTPFPENNIIIFDRSSYALRNCKYSTNTSSEGVRCFGTNTSGYGYSSEGYDVNGVTQKLSKIVTEGSDYLINISVLKNHNQAGVTLCMKNHYGTCNNLNQRMHSNHCDPYIAALNKLPPIATKQKVNICDALFGVKAGGPGGSPQFSPNKIFISTDVVAVDYWGRRLLQESGCNTISRAHHVDTAANEYNLGTNDPVMMDIVNITDPSSTEFYPENNILDGIELQQNTPNPFNDKTLIKFFLSVPSEVNLSIYNLNGEYICNLIQKYLPDGWHQLHWDGSNSEGKAVSSGIYICTLKTKSSERSMIMQFAK